jgi:hypothetical protein
MKKHMPWKPITTILFALTMILCLSLVTQTASAEVTEFQIKSATIPRPGHMDVTVQSNFSPDSPEGRFVRVSVLDSENHVLDTQKADWANGVTETKTFNFINLPYKEGSVYFAQADAYCPTYLHHFQQVSVEGEIRVFVNGYQPTLDVPPIIRDGKTLVPVRGVFEALNAEVSWDEAKQEVTIVKDELTLVLSINQNTALKNGEEIALDMPAQIVNGRTMVPVRFIAETLGAKVEWDPADYAVRILTGTGDIPEF